MEVDGDGGATEKHHQPWGRGLTTTLQIRACGDAMVRFGGASGR